MTRVFGAIWVDGLLRRRDFYSSKARQANPKLEVDFAHAGTDISVALPASMNVSVHDALTSLEMGLLPIQQFGGRAGGQY